MDPSIYIDDEISGSMEHLYIWERNDWLYLTLLIQLFGPYGYVLWVKGAGLPACVSPLWFFG